MENVWPSVMALMKQLDPDPDHAIQVCYLSTRLFDDLYTLLPLNTDDRSLIRAGALLHDIGWSNPTKPHNKASRDIIMNDKIIPFSYNQRVIIALIARYHRKSAPKNEHAFYNELSSEAQNKVRSCAALLRVADALDRTHNRAVSDLICYYNATNILIKCISEFPLNSELLVFEDKSRLLSDLTSRRTILRWKKQNLK
jgi:exopolyphosphatase/pppGpp-phosphohydrolase